MSKNKHAHAEAFCIMTYQGRSSVASITLTIWNSRDGVTPFITYSKEYGVELQHVNFQLDKYAPNYKPKKGDLIWRDLTIEEATRNAENYFDDLLKLHEQWLQLSEKEKQESPNHPGQYFHDYKEAGKEAWVKSSIENLNPGEPHLELVNEDWK